jgi:poly-gamma-glutamate synthesis protein (capsule biosynthesis protein)
MKNRFILAAVGDMAPLRDLTACKPEVNEIWDYMRAADLTIANLEIPLTEANGRADKAMTIKADPGIASSIPEVGINVVNVANNHALDYGVEGLFDTMKTLKQNDIACVGGGEDLDSASRPIFVEKDGLRVAVFGFTSSLPTGYAAGVNRPGVAPIRAHSRFFVDSITLDEQPGISPWVETSVNEQDVEYACRLIAAAREEADLVVVNMHWGIPNGWCAAFQGPLADYQQPLAHALIDAGAHLILGHHPHVIHGIEAYKHGLIAYSLGNFLSHIMAEGHELTLTVDYPPYNFDSVSQGEAREAIILEVILDGKSMTGARFLPMRLNAQGDPEFLDEPASVQVLTRLAKHSKAFDLDIEIAGRTGELNL